MLNLRLNFTNSSNLRVGVGTARDALHEFVPIASSVLKSVPTSILRDKLAGQFLFVVEFALFS